MVQLARPCQSCTTDGTDLTFLNVPMLSLPFIIHIHICPPCSTDIYPPTRTHRHIHVSPLPPRTHPPFPPSPPFPRSPPRTPYLSSSFITASLAPSNPRSTHRLGDERNVFPSGRGCPEYSQVRGAFAALSQLAIATSSANSTALRTNRTRDAFLRAVAQGVEKGLSISVGSAAVDIAIASQLCSLLAAAVPPPSGQSSGGVAAVEAQDWLLQAVTVTERLATALGRLAVPAGSYISGGYDDVHVSAAVPAIAKLASSAAAVMLALRSGPGADDASSSDSLRAGGSTARSLAVRQADHATWRATSNVSTAEVPMPPPPSEQLRRPFRRALRESPSTLFGYAEAYVVLSGPAAAAAERYALGMSYMPSAAAILTAALGPTLTGSGISLRSGLATVIWTRTSNTAAAAAATFAPPHLDGKANYMQIHIPVQGFDSSRTTACMTYDAKTNTLTGPLGTLSYNGTTTTPSVAAVAGASAIFMSYDKDTDRVTCFASVTGSFVVAQGPKSPDSPVAPTASPVGAMAAPAPTKRGGLDTALSAPPQVLMAASSGTAAGAADGGGTTPADTNSTLPQVGATSLQPEGTAVIGTSYVVAATVGAVAGAFLIAAVALAAVLVVRHHRAMKTRAVSGSLPVHNLESGIMYTVPLYEADGSYPRVRSSSSVQQDGNDSDPRVNNASDSGNGSMRVNLENREKGGGESGDMSNRASAGRNGGNRSNGGSSDGRNSRNGSNSGSRANSASLCPPLPTEASLMSPSR
ncbi:hypothetical protein Vafri_18898 [Volvox africanus]|uniref:Uncharacterized protein n=1 Tax=Volvox africanus TaxID=51714 RepID=A0A8J4BNY1_9CHLO|nr:hypothetical protein Vafri_18898 [Volvox africanus]